MFLTDWHSSGDCRCRHKRMFVYSYSYAHVFSHVASFDAYANPFLLTRLLPLPRFSTTPTSTRIPSTAVPPVKEVAMEEVVVRVDEPQPSTDRANTTPLIAWMLIAW